MNEDEIQSAVKRAISIVEGSDVPADLRATVFDKVWTAIMGGGVVAERGRPRRRRRATGARATGERPPAAKARKASGPKGLVTELVEEGFFGDWRTIGDVQEALRIRGHNLKQTALSPALLRLTQEKILQREPRPREDNGEMWAYRKFGV